jgi:hypothetical protein
LSTASWATPAATGASPPAGSPAPVRGQAASIWCSPASLRGPRQAVRRRRQIPARTSGRSRSRSPDDPRRARDGRFVGSWLAILHDQSLYST